ncbi:Rv3235 family protein [Micromonospora chalcea]|uniref:Rv3235 family protein n=1 Tax=Micromonospora chalcea TaxID=1874 RepID=UPI0021A972AF|nr:Rv3235 family protein [Micromonospora chalcea]MCT2278933.1 Rv3235 family protein [Micromonospora chalcea]
MVDTRRPRAPRPPVRLRPAPPLDPPCTDEDTVWNPPGQLALDLADPRRRDPARPAGRAPDPPPAWPRWSSSLAALAPPPPGPAAPAPASGPAAPAPASGTPGPMRATPAPARATPAPGGSTPGCGGQAFDSGTPTSALASATPEGARAAHRFVRTFLEIVNGFRPPGQLRPLCLPEAVGPVAAELTRAARRVTPVRRRTARPALLLRRLRVCEPRAGAVEATAVFVGAGGTSWAVALRLERRRGTWLCLVLDVL